MTSVFGHCRDSFWTVQFNLEVFVNFGVAQVELIVQIWRTRFTFWSSRFRFGADGSTGKHHDLIFWACCDKGFLCML